MLEIQPLLGFLVQGLRTNLYGLACPFYCTGPSIGLILSAFLCGFLLSAGLFAWLLFRFDLFPACTSNCHLNHPPTSPSSVPVGRARAALAGYLHARQPRRTY